MTERDPERIPAKRRKECEHRLGAVVESIEDRTTLIAESLGGLREQLAAVRDRVTRNTEDVPTVTPAMHILRGDAKERVARVESSYPVNGASSSRNATRAASDPRTHT